MLFSARDHKGKYKDGSLPILSKISDWNLLILIKDPEEEVDLDTIDDTGYELVLPSGAKIGHRSLQRYYKQSLNPDKQLVLRKPSEKMLAHYRLVFVSDIKIVTYLTCFSEFCFTYLALWIQ